MGYVIDCCVDFFLQSDVGRSGSLGGEDILRDHHELAKEAPAQDQDGPVLGFVRSAEGDGGRREEKSIALDQLHAVSVSSQEDVQEEVDGNNNAAIESPFVRAGLLLFNHKELNANNDRNNEKEMHTPEILGQKSHNKCPCVCTSECHCDEPPKTVFSFENLRAWWNDTMKKMRKSTLLPYTFCMIIFVGCFAAAVVLTLFITLFCVLPYKAFQLRREMKNFANMFISLF